MSKLRLPRVVTRQGWLVFLGSVLAIVAARLLGSIELFVLGVIGIGLVVTAVLVVRMRRLQLEVSRTVTPPRVHAGASSQVTFTTGWLSVGAGSKPVNFQENLGSCLISPLSKP